MSVIGMTGLARGERRLGDVQLYGGLFAAAVAAFCVSQAVGHRLGLASEVIAIAGDATCGWSWLLVRALFQPPRERRVIWPLLLVLAMVVIGAVLRLPSEASGPLVRMLGNLGALVSSTLLLLAAIEPLTGLRRETTRMERNFRLAFTAGYVAILAVAVIWVDGAPPDSFAARWGLVIKSVCALLALAGMAFAIRHRNRHPLSGQAGRKGADADARSLGDRLLRLMTEQAVYTLPHLKVADVARRLDEAEYKVTQCITGPLGFRNFNQMVNQFRIEEARRRLADPAQDHLPILTVAYDCGFGSIGPFNRAFKTATGMTPLRYRRARPSPMKPA